MRKRGSQLLGLLTIVLLANIFLPVAAPQGQPASATRSANLVSPETTSDVSNPAPAERNPRYRICRDDVLSLSFPLSPELNERVTVQPDGFISLQGAGDLYVQDLTVRELVKAVKKAYVDMLNDPIIDVDLVDFQKPFFTVFGEVGKPGQYSLRIDTTITQAIAVAGGFTPTAKTQVFFYRAVSANWAEVRELKLKDILSGKKISEDVHLRPGDMIFVPEKFIASFKRYVPYSFNITPPYPTTF